MEHKKFKIIARSLLFLSLHFLSSSAQEVAEAASNCATVLHYNPEMITTKSCVSRGDYKWTKKQISEVGSPEQLVTVILMLVTIWILHLSLKTFPRGYFWKRLARLMKWDNKDLMEDLILAIRINMFLKELAVQRDSKNVFK